jgi:hypothetical protein
MVNFVVKALVAAAVPAVHAYAPDTTSAAEVDLKASNMGTCDMTDKVHTGDDQGRAECLAALKTKGLRHKGLWIDGTTVEGYCYHSRFGSKVYSEKDCFTNTADVKTAAGVQCCTFTPAAGVCKDDVKEGVDAEKKCKDKTGESICTAAKAKGNCNKDCCTWKADKSITQTAIDEQTAEDQRAATARANKAAADAEERRKNMSAQSLKKLEKEEAEKKAAAAKAKAAAEAPKGMGSGPKIGMAILAIVVLGGIFAGIYYTMCAGGEEEEEEEGEGEEEDDAGAA